MKLNEIVGLTKNKANNQFSLVIKARKLHQLGIQPEHLLNLKLPKDFKLIKELKGGKK